MTIAVYWHVKPQTKQKLHTGKLLIKDNPAQKQCNLLTDRHDTAENLLKVALFSKTNNPCKANRQLNIF